VSRTFLELDRMGVSHDVGQNSNLRICSTRLSNRQGKKDKSGRKQKNGCHFKKPKHFFSRLL
jgi:hypothetical protein